MKSRFDRIPGINHKHYEQILFYGIFEPRRQFSENYLQNIIKLQLLYNLVLLLMPSKSKIQYLDFVLITHVKVL